MYHYVGCQSLCLTKIVLVLKTGGNPKDSRKVNKQCELVSNRCHAESHVCKTVFLDHQYWAYVKSLMTIKIIKLNKIRYTS